MSIIKEVNESNQVVKAKAVNLLLLPFWYVSIYLFNNFFYTKSDIILTVAMCIVLTLVSSFSLSICLIGFVEKEEGDENVYLYLMTASVTLLCIWLSLLIFIVYSFEFLFNQFIYFYWFIVIYFIPIIILGLFSFIRVKRTEAKKRK